MYAPKFRSWMSSWDRFDEALEARLQAQGDEILADVRRQIAEAMPKEPEPVYNPYLNDIGRILEISRQQWEAMSAGQSFGYLGGIGTSPLLQQLLRPGIDTRF